MFSTRKGGHWTPSMFSSITSIILTFTIRRRGKESTSDQNTAIHYKYPKDRAAMIYIFTRMLAYEES